MRVAIAMVWLVLSLMPAQAVYADAFEQDVFIYDDRLTAACDLQSLFSAEVIERMQSGLPLHLELTVDLVNHVAFWPDNRLQESHYEATIEFQRFGARYRLELAPFTGSPVTETFLHLSDLIESLNDHCVLELAELQKLEAEKSYYVSFNLELRYLSARDLQRAGDWYAGRGDTASQPARQPEGLFQRAFSTLLDLSGLGPQRYRVQSRIFHPGELKRVRP